MDCLDLLALQGTQEPSPTPQFKSINSSGLIFLMDQLSHPYMTTGKTIALTKLTYTKENVLFLFFNFFSFILIYNTVLVLPYIDMNQPRVYMRSQT